MQYWIDAHSAGERESCGDFVGHVRLTACEHAVIVGDVAGRGLEAGNAAGALYDRVRTLLPSLAPLSALVRSISTFFTREVLNEGTPFASLFLALIDERTNVMRYASAGHEPGLLFRADGTHLHIDPTGPVLGFPGIALYRERRVPLTPEDLLVVVTDGITESRRYDGERLNFFGSRGVVRAVRDARREESDPAREIHRSACAHSGGRLADDASTLVLRVAPPVASGQPFTRRLPYQAVALPLASRRK